MKTLRLNPAWADRSRRRAQVGGLLGLVALAAAAGCNTDEAMRAFRDASLTNLQAGLTSVATGVIDGLFAVYELGPDGEAAPAEG